MIILGIDPGYGLVGYGIIEKQGSQVKALDFGAITTPKEQSISQRLKTIFDCINILLKKWQPQEVAIEKLFFNQNVTTGIATAQARGVIVLAAEQAQLPIYEYTPQNVKLALTGMGRADKSQVQFMVQTLLGLKEMPKPDDAADALAVAICHSQTNINMIKGN